MIGELRVHAGEFDFRHVTRRAFLRAHRTRRGAATLSLRLFRRREMAGETLLIVVRALFLQLLVRVVTAQTTDARIVRVVTAAIEHAIWLKANVANAGLARQQHRRFETRVARAAERLR